ncbi:MAG: ATP-binding cassette domain-containing protein [Candidatus Hadarchaeum sp.]|uniref:ATP-binding cassette domain-containing protein n=1 Tax=Candidatus Hadarchaeum sp. TaxID=2883567 RepID=UPI003176A33A
MSAHVKLEKITRKYDGIMALRGISLDVKSGEILTIIGPNGAGKTTLLRILALLDKPSSGKLIYQGQSVDSSNTPFLRKKITMVFQRPILLNDTVFENVAYGLKLRGLTEDEIADRVEAALDSVMLKNFAHRMAKKLSGGEQQRVVLARALVLNPELLLLDEPTANLDPTSATIVEKIIRQLRGRSTVVVATHNIFQAKRLSDRVGCILNGMIIDVDKPKNIFTKPRNEIIRKFVRGEFF